MTEAASSEIRRNSPKFEKQFSEIPSYFLKLVAFVTTSFNLAGLAILKITIKIS
ncbi:hypothetical protein ACFO6U_02125 [Enterococcus canintestini]|uniref:Uncharacterized protein n=1 Tax=Enterococcus canintestini TaxID=317010 RepID=A0A1L8R3E9_9ENTE|nr:hypothetical protein RU96_GL001279 [Enterococcus canintestini]